MSSSIEELLIVVLQFLFEFFLSMFAGAVFDRPSKNRSTPESGFKQLLIKLAELRMLDLIAAPLASGFLYQAIAKRFAERNPNIFPRVHFWKSFWFTLGLVVLRFAYITRG